MREKMVAVSSRPKEPIKGWIRKQIFHINLDCALLYKCSISQLTVTIMWINKASVECSGGMSKDADHVGISGKNS